MKMEALSNFFLIVLIGLLALHPARAADDGSYDALMERAQNEIRSSDWNGLAKTSERLCDLRPDVIWPVYYRGLALTNTGKSAEGEAWLKKAIAIDGSVFWPHFILFFNYLNRGMPEYHDQARVVERRITGELVKSNPDDIRAYFNNYAGHLINAARMEDARAALKRGLVHFPRDPLLRSQYAFTYFRRDMAKWEKLSRETMTLIPRDEQRALQTYALPLRGERIKVHQGNHETISHLGLLNGYHWDFVVVDERGAYGADENRKEGHYVFGAHVFAAAEGTVYFTHDASPDTEPMRNAPGMEPNRVIIRHPNGELSVYYHIKKGSVLVKPGEAVRRGQTIALVGSSGSSVDIPHLHFGILRNGFSVEANLTGFRVLRDGVAADEGAIVPKKNQVLAAP